MGKEKTSTEMIEEGKTEAEEIKKTPAEIKAELAETQKKMSKHLKGLDSKS